MSDTENLLSETSEEKEKKFGGHVSTFARMDTAVQEHFNNIFSGSPPKHIYKVASVRRILSLIIEKCTDYTNIRFGKNSVQIIIACVDFLIGKITDPILAAKGLPPLNNNLISLSELVISIYSIPYLKSLLDYEYKKFKLGHVPWQEASPKLRAEILGQHTQVNGGKRSGKGKGIYSQAFFGMRRNNYSKYRITKNPLFLHGKTRQKIYCRFRLNSFSRPAIRFLDNVLLVFIDEIIKKCQVINIGVFSGSNNNTFTLRDYIIKDILHYHYDIKLM